MAIEITVPRFGWSVEEGTFLEWLKPDGSEVQPGEPLFAIESDKAVQEIEAVDGGRLLIPPQGPRRDEVVKAGQVLGYLLAPGEKPPAMDRAPARPPPPPPAAPAASAAAPAGQPAAAPAVSPRAARHAREQGINLRAVKGTGRNGRITAKDILAARPEAAPVAGRALQPTAMRRAIAERMLNSRAATAPVTLTLQADVSALVKLRDQFKAAWPAGTQPSYTACFIKLAAGALREHPALNASWVGEQIIIHDTINIALAVDTERGLLAPVIRDVPTIGLRELAVQTRDLAARARQRQLSAAECRGGTFTVTNLGTAGVDAFTPIISFPECAVLGIGRIALQPAVDAAGRVVVRHLAWLSLTFDHRLVDGAPAARFLDRLRQLLADPAPVLAG